MEIIYLKGLRRVARDVMTKQWMPITLFGVPVMLRPKTKLEKELASTLYSLCVDALGGE